LVWKAGPSGSRFHAVDLLAGLAGDGVIKGDHQRLVRAKVLYQGIARAAEQDGLVHAVPGVKPVIGGPVGMLAATGTNDIAECAFGRAEEKGEHVLIEPHRAGRGGGGGKGGAFEHLPEQGTQARRGVFF
jgi:hypothetical protein